MVTLLESPKKLLATILITNNFVNILIVLLFAALGEALFGDFKQAIFGIQVRFLIEVVFIAFLILLFGEVFTQSVCFEKCFKICWFYGKTNSCFKPPFNSFKSAFN